MNFTNHSIHFYRKNKGYFYPFLMDLKPLSGVMMHLNFTPIRIVLLTINFEFYTMLKYNKTEQK